MAYHTEHISVCKAGPKIISVLVIHPGQCLLSCSSSVKHTKNKKFFRTSLSSQDMLQYLLHLSLTADCTALPQAMQNFLLKGDKCVLRLFSSNTGLQHGPPAFCIWEPLAARCLLLSFEIIDTTALSCIQLLNKKSLAYKHFQNVFRGNKDAVIFLFLFFSLKESIVLLYNLLMYINKLYKR